MIRGLRIFSMLWLWGVVVLIVGGDLAFVYFAPSKWSAIWEIADDMSPYNAGAWVVKFVLASPGFGAFMLAEWLRRKRARTP